MICRQCGIRIPERYLGMESFRCPNCGKAYYKRPNYPQQSSRQAHRRPAPQSNISRNNAAGFKGFVAAHNSMLLIAFVIGIIYLFVQIGHISSASSYVSTVNPETAEELGTALGTAIGVTLLLPHVVLTAMATIFNAVAWFSSKRWAALTAAILYAVGGVLGLVNFAFVWIPMILCFVAASKLKARRG